MECIFIKKDMASMEDIKMTINEYVPGKGWEEENDCYKDELHDNEFEVTMS